MMPITTGNGVPRIQAETPYIVPQMIEIAMLPSIVRETAVMIRSDIRPQRSDPRGSRRLSTAPMSRGRSIMRKSVRKIAVTRASTRLKPEMMTSRTPPRAPAMPCATSFTFACAVSGAELCWSTHEPRSELVRMSCTSDGSASTKSLNSETIGATSNSITITPTVTSPSTRIVAQAPRPSFSLRCMRRTTGSSTSAMKSERKIVITASPM